MDILICDLDEYICERKEDVMRVSTMNLNEIIKLHDRIVDEVCKNKLKEI